MSNYRNKFYDEEYEEQENSGLINIITNSTLTATQMLAGLSSGNFNVGLGYIIASSLSGLGVIANIKDEALSKVLYTGAVFSDVLTMVYASHNITDEQTKLGILGVGIIKAISDMYNVFKPINQKL